MPRGRCRGCQKATIGDQRGAYCSDACRKEARRQGWNRADAKKRGESAA
jgi:hypothetical protein